jgi:hypothetical protein
MWPSAPPSVARPTRCAKVVGDSGFSVLTGRPLPAYKPANTRAAPSQAADLFGPHVGFIVDFEAMSLRRLCLFRGSLGLQPSDRTMALSIVLFDN